MEYRAAINPNPVPCLNNTGPAFVCMHTRPEIKPMRIPYPLALRQILPILFLLLGGISTPSRAGALVDTTLFRIQVLQDTVYPGDTVDVDIFLGGEGLLGILNILEEFELEVATDTALIVQDQISFRLDSSSLSTFFGSLFSNLTITELIDPVLGTLNVKAKSPTLSNGNARVGRGKYIVQDNAAGRQYMKFNFNKAISKSLLGILNPVKIQLDSVYIAERVVSGLKPVSGAGLNVYPNPAGVYLTLDGLPQMHYIYNIYDGGGALIRSGEIPNSAAPIQIETLGLPPGPYLLILQGGNQVFSSRFLKQ